MGFSYYWRGSTKTTVINWAQIIDDIQRVVAVAGIPLAGGSGTGRPVFTNAKICFNGRGKNAHETFIVEKDKDIIFASCKTAYESYNKIVCACLMVLAHRIPTFKFSSDGDLEKWRPAVALVQATLAYGVYPCCNSVDAPIEPVSKVTEAPPTDVDLDSTIIVSRVKLIGDKL